MKLGWLDKAATCGRARRLTAQAFLQVAGWLEGRATTCANDLHTTFRILMRLRMIDHARHQF